MLHEDLSDLDLRGAYLVRRYIADENYLFESQSISPFHRTLYLAWLITSDCGRSLLRWFAFLLGATLIFAAIYAFVDIDYGDYQTPFSPIYFSFVTLTTLGCGDALPASLPAQESECFTAAFLQDMALPFLACHRTDDYDPILKQWHLEGGDLAALEQEFVDWDHTEVATWICSEWGLPENIALAIKTHHQPSADIDYEPLGPVRLVSFFRESESHDGVNEIIAEARAVYNVSEEEMQVIVESSFETAEELAQMISCA